MSEGFLHSIDMIEGNALDSDASHPVKRQGHVAFNALRVKPEVLSLHNALKITKACPER
jgi:hypothetical protein